MSDMKGIYKLKCVFLIRNSLISSAFKKYNKGLLTKYANNLLFPLDFFI